MIGSMFTGQDSRRRRVKHRAEAEFNEAEARPVSCACARVCGKCRLSFFAQEFGLLIDVASLLIELVRHRSENQARALVVLAMGQIATMLGMEPKLLCGAAH